MEEAMCRNAARDAPPPPPPGDDTMGVEEETTVAVDQDMGEGDENATSAPTVVGAETEPTMNMPMRKKIRLTFMPDENCGSGNSTDDEKDMQQQLQARLFTFLRSGDTKHFTVLFNQQSARTKQSLLTVKDDVGFTLLMGAVKCANLDVCRLLIAHHVDVNELNEKKSSALFLAAQKGLVDITDCLIEGGASVEFRSAALVPAAHFGHIDVVNLLLNKGADANFANQKGTTPLMRAAQEGQAAVVTSLLRKNADANAANMEGMTALMLASQRGHAHIAEILINAGALVDKQTRQGSTALLLAAKRGHACAITTLLSAGADMFLKDERDKTALDNAARRGNEELIRILTIDNQQMLMKTRLRKIRSYELVKMYTLFMSGRAQLVPSPCVMAQQRTHVHNHSWLIRSFGLPKPLFRNIVQFLPLCRTWTTQLRNLNHHLENDPSHVVHKGIHIMDEILFDAKLDVRELESINGVGQLVLVRDSPLYQHVLTSYAMGVPMPMELLEDLRHHGDLQGVLLRYPNVGAIEFGLAVASKVLSTLHTLLIWDEQRRRLAIS
ncbi:unnamed protein product [Aphanomyces euteiches]|uniref:Uncharacterized protein n=1 Tax=Aphanomyces euteiches TaxID=100861 RepID=A0A6G0XQC3_9STRA|nr:hypothetical protein Ae201684_002414 [Aphanomyces euteiches]KAH9087413.1 hypothetical protein Ae201684P_000823 [Aphanomyces euteiches]